jgi:DUF971 family protein
MGADVWPTDLKLTDEGRVLRVSFEGGEAFDLPAEFLRVLSPSAEVRGHTPAERQTVAGKSKVRVLKLEPVGAYAVRIVFDDGHDSGLYSWAYLHEIGAGRDRLWADHLAELAAKGLAR